MGVQSPALLAADEPPAVEVTPGRAPVVLLCEHASNRVPRSLNGLGIAPAELQRHIAWDIGAAAVTRGLAAALGATAVLAGYSRLVVDCNRAPGDSTAMPATSDGTPVPANHALTAQAIDHRLTALYHPFHAAAQAAIARVTAAGAVPVVVCLHSFTPVMDDTPRPWHVGVLWNHDPRLAAPLMAKLRAQPGLVVGDNQPYSGRLLYHTLDRHAGAAGLPHVSVEIRQDLVGDAAGQGRWVAQLSAILGPLVADAGLRVVRRYPLGG